MKEQTKKIWNTVLNVVIWVIIAIVLLLAISVVTSIKKGYSSLFGYAMLGVATDSMKGDEKDSFGKYNYIFVKILDKDEVAELEIGDVITYQIDINGDGKDELNTHRIVGGSAATGFVTQGDNNSITDQQAYGYTVSTSEIVGKYMGFRIPLIGGLSVLVRSSVGFLCVVVIPSFLIVAYAVFSLIKSAKVYNSEKSEEIKASVTDEERERIRRQVMEEMAREQALKDNTPPTADPPHDEKK